MPSFLETQPAPLDHRGGIDPYAAFRVESPRDVAALMRELNDTATPVRLAAPDGVGLSTVIWTVDPGAGRLSMRAELDDPQLQALIEADECTAVAYLESVKLQFELEQLVLVRGSRSCALQARLPRIVYRFQRRQAYRVRTLERTAPSAMLRHPARLDLQFTLRVLDVSIGGCALLLPDNVPPPEVGSLLPGARIELDADTRFDATLRLQHVTSAQHETSGLRLGCALLDLHSDAERALQRYIDQTQKRRRLLTVT
jgi:c-di-GMP-binding flagellar brake protein YcgR